MCISSATDICRGEQGEDVSGRFWELPERQPIRIICGDVLRQPTTLACSAQCSLLSARYDSRTEGGCGGRMWLRVPLTVERHLS